MFSGLRRVLMRLRAFVARGQAERELEREIAAHVLMLVQRGQRQGLSLADAQRAARLALGGLDQTKEQQRDARSFPLLEDLRRDLAYSLRTLSTARGFTTAAVLTLALGIGAATALFTVAYALLLKPLPFAMDAEQIVRVLAVSPNTERPDEPPRRGPAIFTQTEVSELRSRLRSLTEVGLVSPTIMALTGRDDAGRLTGARISASAMALLGVQPVVGRAILPEDENTGHDVVLLSHALWQRLFAADPAVVDRTVTFDSVLGRRETRPYTVIGVMPPTFSFPNRQTQFWMPPSRPTAGAAPFRAPLLARLQPGVTPQMALAEIEPVLRELRPQASDVRYDLVREQDELVRAVRPALLALTGSALVLLLIAALNVANLQLARTLARQREFAVRAAVGAGRGRLVRQCATESAVLGLLGGLAGLAFAAAAITALRTFAASSSRFDLVEAAELPRMGDVAFDGVVVAATLAMSVAVGIVVGLAGAHRAVSADTRAASGLGLAGASTRAGASGGWPARRSLIVLQVACALTLAIGATLLARSLWNLTDVDPGYSREQVFAFQVNLPASNYPDERLREFAAAFTGRLQAVPGVETAAYANQLPLVGLRDTAGGLWRMPDATRKGATDGADARLVSQRYFETVGMRLRSGRAFEERDDRGQPRVLLINEALARRQFPGEDPIGVQVYVGRDPSPWQIVGIVADVRQFGLEREPEPQFFVDLRQWSTGMPLFPGGAYYVLRTRESPEALLPTLRAIARSLDAEAAVFNAATMATMTAFTTARPRLYATVVGGFAVVGVLLAAVGIFGVLAYLVRERTSEIGIRMALGAKRVDIVRMVTSQGLTVVTIGILVGILGAAGLTRYLEALLFGVTPLDPSTFALTAGLFLAVATLAVLGPAYRATRVDPLAAMRAE